MRFLELGGDPYLRWRSTRRSAARSAEGRPSAEVAFYLYPMQEPF